MKPAHSSKRDTDLQIIGEWIEPGSRVLDLGCGRGVLLEQLRLKRNVNGIGVDTDADKVEACVRRGVPVYQGDAAEFLKVFDAGHFDWVVISRTMQELEKPALVLDEALRVGRRLAVGFANHDYCCNQMRAVCSECPERGDAGAEPWPLRRPQNPVGVTEFEKYCQNSGITIIRRKYLGEDWRSEVEANPATCAAYALYALERAGV